MSGGASGSHQESPRAAYSGRGSSARRSALPLPELVRGLCRRQCQGRSPLKVPERGRRDGAAGRGAGLRAPGRKGDGTHRQRLPVGRGTGLHVLRERPRGPVGREAVRQRSVRLGPEGHLSEDGRRTGHDRLPKGRGRRPSIAHRPAEPAGIQPAIQWKCRKGRPGRGGANAAPDAGPRSSAAT